LQSFCRPPADQIIVGISVSNGPHASNRFHNGLGFDPVPDLPEQGEANLSRTIGIIQARMGSERLPGKILAPLAGQPALALLIDRIRSARVSEWWLATSSEAADDVTEAWGFELGLRVFRGHASDVLSRFVAIGQETRADWVIPVSADNLFLDAALIDSLLDARDASEAAKQADALELRGGFAIDCESGCSGTATPGRARTPRLPIGYKAELVRCEALERASRRIAPNEPHHRVHVTSWLYANANVHAVPTPLCWPDRPDWRWTIDTYEDLAMARSAFRVFGDEATTIDYPTMVARLDAHPEITGTNQHIAQKSLEEG